jgi:hypothetical protein
MNVIDSPVDTLLEELKYRMNISRGISNDSHTCRMEDTQGKDDKGT